MAERDAWEKAESLSKVFAAVLIPVVLGVAGFFANCHLEKQRLSQEQAKLDHDLLKQAIDVVFLSKTDQISGDSKSFESRRAHRSHWLETYNSLANVKLSNDFIAIVMEQDTKAAEKELYRWGNLPEMIAKSENAQGVRDTNEDDMGHGWVSVGRLNSDRYSDVNFDASARAIEPSGKIKPAEIIRARWSVSLRLNTRNLEDRQDYSGTARGLLWGGECVKVIDSLIDQRKQTWAFIEIVQCPVTARS